MSKLNWKPWHEVVQVRDDLKSGQLTLSIFAADLYDVVMGRAKPVYQQPSEFFALTYPTFNLRELAKDVVTRLAGKSDKAIRQLELTYGGGKTHTLIALLHLVSEPEGLRKLHLAAVDEFLSHITFEPPKSRVIALAFDKLDAEKGMEVRSPAEKVRWLRNPWSVLAYQIAGDDGLKLLHPDGKAEERDSAPAQPLLETLLRKPQEEGLSTLILMDEVLMYAREKVGLDPAWRSRLVNFFQYLTQAALKVDRCAIVASLLATDPNKSDALGKQITQELYTIFRREREEGVQPVLKEDVAEVLRRRFFKPESIKDRESFRPHVVAALEGIKLLDDQTRKDAKGAEDRFLKSYPFHPDLTDLFYTKWTNLESFQRTRGVLRTFALAIRDSEAWNDQCPLIGPNVFLGNPTKGGIPEAARELTTVAGKDVTEGKTQEWTAILEGELQKAREIQNDTAGLKFREIEQAVFSTFLHSQPPNQKALLRDLLLLIGATRPDKIELEKSLRRWTEVSWFLDEASISDTDPAASQSGKQLPKSWRLGSRPNLKQMHYDACTRVSPDLVDAKLLTENENTKSLTAGARAAGAEVHPLPKFPRDIDDEGKFHYVVLGPKAASESGKPSSEAKRFIDEKTGPENERVYRNAIVLAVPSKDGLDVARKAVRDHLGWEEVSSQLKGQDVDPIRFETLSKNRGAARRAIEDAIQQAYCIVVTVTENNEVHAFKISPAGGSLFTTIKSDRRSRIQDTAVSADALLPGGPYSLWKDGDTERYVSDLVGAFARNPHLPKMMNRQAIIDTITQGCRDGLFVLRSTRPDKSVRTYWRRDCSDIDLKDIRLAVVLPEAATLTEISPALLAPGALPELWNGNTLNAGDVSAYFGGRTIKVKKEGYEETMAVPKADDAVVTAAIGKAVEDGKLWLTSGAASLLAEPVPAGVIEADAILKSPPAPIPTTDLSASSLPDLWKDQVVTAEAISSVLSAKSGTVLPWLTVREAIDGGLRARLIERTIDSGPWPADYGGAKLVKIKLASTPTPPTPPPPPTRPGVFVAESDLRPGQLQDLADQIGEITKAAVGVELKVRIRLELGGKTKPSPEMIAAINEKLASVTDSLKLS
jgi:Protein of unknown function (DUF499)